MITASWELRCLRRFGLETQVFSTWRKTFIEFCTLLFFTCRPDIFCADYWRNLFGLVYGEYWGVNSYENSFKFSVGPEGIRIHVMYDLRYAKFYSSFVCRCIVLGFH